LRYHYGRRMEESQVHFECMCIQGKLFNSSFWVIVNCEKLTFAINITTRLQPDTHVRKIVHTNNRASHAIVEDLISGEIYVIKAKIFVVACGAILSPQLLHTSRIGKNVGLYLTDHPVAFCEFSVEWTQTQTTKMLQQLTTPLPILFFSPKHRHKRPSHSRPKASRLG
jgi:hypothetical protein